MSQNTRIGNRIGIGLISVALFTGSWLDAGEAPEGAEPHSVPSFRLREYKPIILSNSRGATKKEEKTIRGLIHGLASLEGADVGMSSESAGTGFTGTPESEGMRAMLLYNLRLWYSPSFEELVKLGPKALPYLLQALGDETPTKIHVRHNFAYGGMYFENGLRGNPANAKEADVLIQVPSGASANSEHRISSYTIKVGDICFAAVGEIVGRPYIPLRFQAGPEIVISSPTHDTNLCRQVRAIWSSADADQHLLDSLLLDFSTVEAVEAGWRGSWMDPKTIQPGAGWRLSRYYPRETAQLIAARLDVLDVKYCGTNIDSYWRREDANGVETAALIKHVAHSQESSVRQAVQNIFLRTDDPDILAAAAAAVDPKMPKAYRSKLEETIAGISKQQEGEAGLEGLLIIVALHFDDGAEPIFERYLESGSLECRRTACRVFQIARPKWCFPMLTPFLNDRRGVVGDYSSLVLTSRPTDSLRICDEAADILDHHFKIGVFKLASESAERDRQIELIKQRIARKSY